MSDPSYDSLLKRGRCLLSYGDDEYEVTDKEKDKTQEVPRRMR